MGYIWSIYGYFEALISQILAFLWSEFLLYQFSAPNLDKGTIFFPTPRPRMIEQYIPLPLPEQSSKSILEKTHNISLMDVFSKDIN